MNKVVTSAAEAVRDIPDGAVVMMSGFGLCGIPENLILALRDQGAKGLTVVSNNAGVTDFGISFLLEERPGPQDDRDLRGREQGLRGHVPRRLARGRAQPAGHLRRADPRGRGRDPRLLHARRVRHGRRRRQGGPLVRREAATSWRRALRADFALVKAWKGDTAGNLVFRKTARNFGPMMCQAARTTIAEVEHLVPTGALEPDHVHVPGIYVHRVLQGAGYEKRIERRTLRGEGADGDRPEARAHREARRPRDEGRRLREPRHRHADPRRQLRARGRLDRAALRERHAGRRALPGGRARRTPTSSTRARRR